MSDPTEPPAPDTHPADAAERELVAAVAAALATLPLAVVSPRPIARARRSAWRMAGRRRAMRPMRR